MFDKTSKYEIYEKFVVYIHSDYSFYGMFR